MTTYCTLLDTGTCARGDGDAGEEGAVLELEELLLDVVFGVVVEELPELTVELESDTGRLPP